MLGRAWGFVKRHKKKAIAGTILAGGAYGIYRYVYPMVKQFREIRAALESLEAAAAAGAGQEDAEADEERRRVRFRHNQEVYDKYACKGLGVFRERHDACFEIQECMSRVREAQDAEAKRVRLEEYVTECLAYCISALYALHALLLLQRMQFNIAGREMDLLAAAEPQADAPAYEAFLESTSYFKEEGVRRVADSARRAARACAAEAGLAPATAVTAERLHKLVQDAFLEVDAEILAGPCASSSLLPESIDSGLAPALCVKAKRLLDEARDYLESPQFLEAFRAASAAAARRLAGLLGDDAQDPASAPLAGGQPKPLAKLLGEMISASRAALAEESAGGFVEQFAAQPLVCGLCERVYFQTAAA